MIGGGIDQPQIIERLAREQRDRAFDAARIPGAAIFGPHHLGRILGIALGRRIFDAEQLRARRRPLAVDEGAAAHDPHRPQMLHAR